MQVDSIMHMDGLRRRLFQFPDEKGAHDPDFSLTAQHRSNPTIVSWSDRVFYEGRIRNGPSVTDNSPHLRDVIVDRKLATTEIGRGHHGHKVAVTILHEEPLIIVDTDQFALANPHPHSHSDLFKEVFVPEFSSYYNLGEALALTEYLHSLREHGLQMSKTCVITHWAAQIVKFRRLFSIQGQSFFENKYSIFNLAYLK